MLKFTQYTVFEHEHRCVALLVWLNSLWIYCKSTMFTRIWPLWACTKYAKIVGEGNWKPQ